MIKKIKAATSAVRVHPRQKSSTRPATSARPNDRVTDAAALARAVKLARAITQHYSLRTWARWTHHQKHGWWSQVSAGAFREVRFTWRDLDDLEKVHQRCLDEKHFDQELLRALDDIEVKQNALTISIESARNLLRRKARALLVEQQGGRR
jgi:hypothetical protein